MRLMGVSEEVAEATELSKMMRHFDYEDIENQMKAKKQSDAQS